MKVLLVTLVSVLLALGIVGFTTAATEQAVTASVSVTGAASITVSSTNLDFGSMSEGQTKNATVNPLVITVDANTGYSVKTKSDAATFTGPGVLNDENLKWATALAGTYTGYDTTAVTVVSDGTSPGTTHNLYHQLTVPADTVAGSYSLPITLSVTTP